jgi:hypothetical protein
MSRLEVIQPERVTFSVGDAVRFKQVSPEEFTQQGGQICPN